MGARFVGESFCSPPIVLVLVIVLVFLPIASHDQRSSTIMQAENQSFIGSMPLSLMAVVAAGEARKAISAFAASGSLAPTTMPAEKIVIFCKCGFFLRLDRQCPDA